MLHAQQAHGASISGMVERSARIVVEVSRLETSIRMRWRN